MKHVATLNVRELIVLLTVLPHLGMVHETNVVGNMIAMQNPELMVLNQLHKRTIPYKSSYATYQLVRTLLK